MSNKQNATPANGSPKATLFAHRDVDSAIQAAIKSHGDAKTTIALAIVAAIGHAIVYGNADKLNHLYDGAEKYRPEMVEFVRKINAFPCGNQGTIQPQAARIFKFAAKEKKFSVLSDRLKARQYLAHFSMSEDGKIVHDDNAQDATVETLRQIWNTKSEDKPKTESTTKPSVMYLLGQFKTMRNKIGTTYSEDDVVAVEFYELLTGYVNKLEKQAANLEKVA